MSSIYFRRSNNIEYVYSNVPENIKTAATQYTVEKELIANKYCAFEFYHCFYSPAAGNKLVLVLKNYSSSSATINVAGGNTRTAAGESNGSPVTYACAQNCLDYINGENRTSFTLNPGQTYIVASCNNMQSGYFAVGKYVLVSNIAGVKARIAYGSGATSGDGWFVAPRAEAERTASNQNTDDVFRLSGTVGYYSASTDNIDLQQISSFCICEHDHFDYWPPSSQYSPINTGEYAASTDYMLSGCNFLAKNYGVLYNINLTNCAGKKMIISPPKASKDESATSEWFSNVCLFVNGAWDEYRFQSFSDPNSAAPIEILLDNNVQSQTIKLYNVGGNDGNFIFTFT